MNINNQQSEKSEYRADGTLEVVDVFYTVQGEGPFTGTPAVFVRLAGCNLNCPYCDTDYTTGRHYSSVEQLALRVHTQFDTYPPAILPQNAKPPRDGRLVVITGGEPFRQNIGPFVRKLLGHGYLVQIETNGTLFQENFPYSGNVTIVCSPKVGRVHERLKMYINHLKYVVEAGKQHEQTRLPLYVLGNPTQVDPPWPGFRGTIWIAPADQQNDECNKANVEAVVDAALTKGYRVSVQTHKILGVP